MDVSTRTLTRTARDGGYAVPAVNVFDELSMRAVVAAAVRTSAPLIVQISVKTVRSSGTAFTTDLFRRSPATSPCRSPCTSTTAPTGRCSTT